MQEFLLGLLSFLCTLRCLTSVDWAVVVQPEVRGSMGKNVILPCVFKHPRQNTYASKITVKWIQNRVAKPIFLCSLRNQTDRQDLTCSDPRSPKRFWLHGNPRRGDLSLGINDSQFTDISRYICRVELDYESYQSRTSTLLNITAPAEILNLTLDLQAQAQGGMLKCIAQGNPIPSVKWMSLAKSQETVPISKTENSDYTVISSIPFSGQDVFTCQAVNSLGQAERTFPPKPLNDSGLLVWISALGCLLFLGMLVVVGVVVKKGRNAQSHLTLQTGKICIDQPNDTPIYANVSYGERHLPLETPVRGLNDPVYGHSKESTYIERR
ncbi:sialic acid binding Ig-like lectin 15, like [Triplophysa rosa]|uniref:sialic acid binding Ig-like lectin 15, like n=1 Tax=Triplophysa rosa TaxID=992332 RepID=UPI002545FF17|nr:sialic acid binding Ig-like lectin 15, like [Triplophysa rosa]